MIKINSALALESRLSGAGVIPSIVLLYGTDEGAVSLLCSKLTKRFFATGSEGEQQREIFEYGILSKNVSILQDFLWSRSLFASKRILIVEKCTESFNQQLLEIILRKELSNDLLMIFIAGEVKKSSKIVKIFEAIDAAAVVPCYKPDYKEMVGIIKRWFVEHKAEYEQGLPEKLAVVMPSNRLLIEQELNKLFIYCNAVKIDIDQARNLFHSYKEESSLEAMATAFFQRDVRSLCDALNGLYRADYPIIMIIRALQNYAMRLKSVKEVLQRGYSLDNALKTLVPPLFFKVKNNFITNLKKHDVSALNKALYSLLHIEVRFKSDAVRNKNDYLTNQLINLCS